MSQNYPLERETHVAYLISLGFSPVTIADRLGHSSTVITDQYSHLYPSAQTQLAEKLEADRAKNHKRREDENV